MAAIDRPSAALRALTAAAIALPGLQAAQAAVDDEPGIDLRYGHYQEGPRELFGVKSAYDPIEADSLKSALRLSLGDRVRLALGFSQDTWSGATPIATAPREQRGNRPRDVDGVSSATPLIDSSSMLFLDAATLVPLRSDGYGTLLGGTDTQLIETLSSASPETRKQFDFSLVRDGDASAVSVGGGVSRERDYLSRFANLGLRLDLDQRRTTLSADLSHTWSRTAATLDHDALPYILDRCVPCGFSSDSSTVEIHDGTTVLRGRRRDLSAHLGATRVLGPDTLLSAGAGYTRSRGYLANPYKVVEVGFIDPEQQFSAPPGTVQVYMTGLLEQRPDRRRQFAADAGIAHYVAGARAALHADYRYFDDDWGIRAHTLELQWAQPLGGGWTVTPRLRYYSQSAADFYTPYLLTAQSQRPAVVDPVRGPAYFNSLQGDNGPVYYDDPNVANPDGFNPNTGNPVVDAAGNPVSQDIANDLVPKRKLFDRSQLPKRFSSDWRLAGYGSLSLGLTLARQFGNGLILELGLERYRHAASLRLGGSDGNGFGDFHYTLWNATLRYDVGARPLQRRADPAMADGGFALVHDHAASHVAADAPAGIGHLHGPQQPGSWSLGYRYEFRRAGGGLRRGTHGVDDDIAHDSGCTGLPCIVLPERMHMHMHMFEIGYALNEQVSLMVMPQYVDMTMRMRGVLRDGDLPAETFERLSLYQHHRSHPHTTGGIGDTKLRAQWNVGGRPSALWTAGIGISLPTGRSGVKLRGTHGLEPTFTHYDMQLGSGTLDVEPGVAVTGHRQRWTYGASLDGTLRAEARNDHGYRLGNELRANAWTGWRLNEWVSTSLRAAFAAQGRIHGAYDGPLIPLGPMDEPRNAGGRFLDAGLGLQVDIPSGAFRGLQFKLEWLEPLRQDPNGIQLKRQGALNVGWSAHF